MGEEEGGRKETTRKTKTYVGSMDPRKIGWDGVD
jgi:hypothetical protein